MIFMHNSLNSLNMYGCVGMPLLSGATKEALMSELSDMDYLRSKVANTETAEESEEKNADEEVEGDDADEDISSVQHPDSAYESGENATKTKPSASSKNKMQSKDKKNAQQEVTVEEEPWCYTFPYTVVFAISLWCFTACLSFGRWSQRHHSQWSWEEHHSTWRRWAISRRAVKIFHLTKHVCFQCKFILFATATNSGVYDSAEACSNQDWEEWKWKQNRLDINWWRKLFSCNALYLMGCLYTVSSCIEANH